MIEERTSDIPRKKIAVLIRNFVTTGGAERYAVEVTKRLAQLHQITVLCQTHDPSHCEGLEIITIPRLCVQPRWINQVLFAYQCSKVTRAGDFDLVHSHERTWDYNVYVVHCPCYKTKFAEAGSHGLFKYHLKALFSLRHAAYRWLEKQQFSDKPHRVVVSVSDYITRNIRYCYPEFQLPVVVAPPGVEMPLKRCSAPTVDGPFNILFVGTEFERKGLEFALRGFAKLQRSNARLAIAGGGNPASYQGLIRELGIESKVQFLGLVRDVSSLYASSHLFLFPTLIEPFGMSPLEAMAHGLPVVVSDRRHNGFVEQLQEGEAWVLKDARDADEIGKALEALAEGGRWCEMSEKSLKVAARLNWEFAAGQIDLANQVVFKAKVID